jgi:hypothetical protein
VQGGGSNNDGFVEEQIAKVRQHWFVAFFVVELAA